MDLITATLLLLGVFVGFPVLILWIRHQLKASSQPASDKSPQSLQHRLLHPDVSSVEKYFDHPLPTALKTLYFDQAEILRKNFSLDLPSKREGDFWYIASYQPLDMRSIEESPPDCKNFLMFANDAFGSGFIIDPRRENPAVYFFEHETSEKIKVSERLTDFLSATKTPLQLDPQPDPES